MGQDIAHRNPRSDVLGPERALDRVTRRGAAAPRPRCTETRPKAAGSQALAAGLPHHQGHQNGVFTAVSGSGGACQSRLGCLDPPPLAGAGQSPEKHGLFHLPWSLFFLSSTLACRRRGGRGVQEAWGRVSQNLPWSLASESQPKGRTRRAKTSCDHDPL